MEKEFHAYLSFLKILNEHGFNELAFINISIGLNRAGGIFILRKKVFELDVFLPDYPKDVIQDE